MTCPKCGSTDSEFRYTEPTYGDWWKCKKCGTEFPGDQKRYDEFMAWASGSLQSNAGLMLLAKTELGVRVENLSVDEIREILLLVREIEQRDAPGRMIVCLVTGLEKKSVAEVHKILEAVFPRIVTGG